MGTFLFTLKKNISDFQKKKKEKDSYNILNITHINF